MSVLYLNIINLIINAQSIVNGNSSNGIKKLKKWVGSESPWEETIPEGGVKQKTSVKT